MIPFSFGALMAAAFLAGAADAAEPIPAPHCVPTARFDLAAESSDAAADVCVSADEPTTFVFDSRVVLGGVEFQPEGGLADWGQGKEGTSLLVIPKPGYLPGERVRVTVRFADGTIPASASFWLVGHPAIGTRRVEVYRQPRSADAYKRDAADAKADARQCEEKNARLLAEHNEPGGLMGAAWLERGGAIASKALSAKNIYPASALSCVEGWSYSFTRVSGTRAASLSVRLLLSNPGAEPWMAAGAVLRDSTGVQVELAAWQASPILPAGEGDVVVGTQNDPGQFACPCTLKLWEAPGTRVVTLGNVTFPDGPKPKP